jgi:hypothetical protein
MSKRMSIFPKSLYMVRDIDRVQYALNSHFYFPHLHSSGSLSPLTRVLEPKQASLPMFPSSVFAMGKQTTNTPAQTFNADKLPDRCLVFSFGGAGSDRTSVTEV